MVKFTHRLAAFLAAALMLGSAALSASADPQNPGTDDTSSYSEDITNVSDDTPGTGLDNPGSDTSSASETPPAEDTSPETPAEEPAAAITLSAPNLTARTNLDTIKLTWNRVDNADKYYIYKLKSGRYKRIAVTRSLRYTDKKVPADTTQFYKVYAVKGSKKKASKIKVKPSPMRILKLNKETRAYTDTNTMSTIKLRAGYYTGYCDSINYDGFCVVYTRGIRRLVKIGDVVGVGGDYKSLPLGAVSQLDGNYFKGYACGPGAATMLFNSISGKNITVETAIKIAKSYGVTVYGDYTFMTNGIPCKGVKELVRAMISKYGISGKTVKVFNTSNYGSASSLVKAFKTHIDRGERMIVCVTEDSWFTSTGTDMTYTANAYDPTHYAVITGYTVSNGKTYFFTGDSWYSDTRAYNYAKKNQNRNRTTARFYYGLVCTEGNALARSVMCASKVTKDLGQVIYVADK